MAEIVVIGAGIGGSAFGSMSVLTIPPTNSSAARRRPECLDDPVELARDRPQDPTEHGSSSSWVERNVPNVERWSLDTNDWK
jgi:hypothetical protein